MCVPSGIRTVEITSFPLPQSTSMVIAQFPPLGGVLFVKLTIDGIFTNQKATDDTPFNSKEGLGIRLFSLIGEIIESLQRKDMRAKSSKTNKGIRNLFFIIFAPLTM